MKNTIEEDYSPKAKLLEAKSYVVNYKHAMYCPNCDYSVKPKVYYTERKHGELYRVECSRCLYIECDGNLSYLCCNWEKAK